MNGRYNGLQAKVAAKNNMAAWIPCAGHSLNLVVKAAAECCTAAMSFFDILECVYVFFTASTHRCEVMSNALKSADISVCVPKRINTTRWSCRADANKAFVQGYLEIKKALAELADNPNEVPTVRSESNGLYERMCLLETGIYSVFWNDIGLLERVNATSRKLQDPKLDLNAAVAMVGLSRPNVKPSPSTNDMEQSYLAHQTTCRLASVHAMFASTMVRRRMLNSLLLRSFVSPVTFR